MMKTTVILVAAMSLSTASHAFIEDLGKDKISDVALTDMVSDNISNMKAGTGLSSLLTDKLPISTDQAATGSAALLNLASNKLSGSQSTELSNMIPGMDQLGALGGITNQLENISAVKGVFESIGLDPALIGQFTPIILGYLQDEGASNGLMSSLGSIWND